jgi:hypothetical protein
MRAALILAAVVAAGVALAAVSVSVMILPAISAVKPTLFPSSLQPEGPYCVANALAPAALNRKSHLAANKWVVASVQHRGRSQAKDKAA